MEVTLLKTELAAAISKESEAQTLILTLAQELRMHDGELKALATKVAASKEEVADMEVEMATANSMVKALRDENQVSCRPRSTRCIRRVEVG